SITIGSKPSRTSRMRDRPDRRVGVSVHRRGRNSGRRTKRVLLWHRILPDELRWPTRDDAVMLLRPIIRFANDLKATSHVACGFPALRAYSCCIRAIATTAGDFLPPDLV